MTIIIRLLILFLTVYKLAQASDLVFGPMVYDVRSNSFSVLLTCEKTSDIVLYLNGKVYKKCKADELDLTIKDLKPDKMYSYFFLINKKMTPAYNVKTLPLIGEEAEVFWVDKPAVYQDNERVILKFKLNKGADGAIIINDTTYPFIFRREEVIDLKGLLPIGKVSVKLVIYGKERDLVYQFELIFKTINSIIKSGPIIGQSSDMGSIVYICTVNTRVNLYVNGKFAASSEGEVHDFKIDRKKATFYFEFPEFKSKKTPLYKINVD